MPEFVKIAIIEDDESVRRALARLLKSVELEPVTFSSAAEFLSSLQREAVDCVVSDVRMPELDGLQLQAELARTLPHLSVIFVTGYGDIPMTVDAMRNGALDFLEKPIDERALLRAVQTGVVRTRTARVSQLELSAIKQRLATLTPREREVFSMVAAGMLNKQIGFDLGTAERTVKVHRGRVMRKMKAGSSADLVRMSERLDLL